MSLEEVRSRLELFEVNWKALSHSDLEIILDTCDRLFKREIVSETGQQELLQVWRIGFRLLRNLSIIPLYQDAIGQQDWIVLLFEQEIAAISDGDHTKFFLQFICNLITNNAVNQERIWKASFPDAIERIITQQPDEDTTHVLLVWIYNTTIKDTTKLARLCTNGKEIVRFIITLLDSENGNIFEWVVYFFRLFLSEGHLETIYDIAKRNGTEEPNDEQLNILRLANERIHSFAQQEQRSTEVITIIPVSSVHFLIALLAHSFRNIEKQEELSENRTQGLFVLLDLFGDLTSCIHDCPYIRNGIFEANLTLLCIDLLRKLSQGKPGEGIKGLKVNLVRILGNLCFRDFATQEQIRTAGGIELLLSHSKIDPRNEYIKEWSVLAIRNLCENNETNQQFIQSLQPQEVVEVPDEFNSAGIQCEIVDGKLSYKPPKKD